MNKKIKIILFFVSISLFLIVTSFMLYFSFKKDNLNNTYKHISWDVWLKQEKTSHNLYKLFQIDLYNANIKVITVHHGTYIINCSLSTLNSSLQVDKGGLYHLSIFNNIRDASGIHKQDITFALKEVKKNYLWIWISLSLLSTSFMMFSFYLFKDLMNGKKIKKNLKKI